MPSNSSGEGGLVTIVVIGLILWGISALFFGEREGTVNVSDCRETISLQPDTFQKYYKTFTCTTQKTKSGLLMRGVCIHVDTDGSIFSSSHSCAVAYVYEKKQEGHCTDPKFPYLGEDDKCYSWPQ
jgi:hypothetical protein